MRLSFYLELAGCCRNRIGSYRRRWNRWFCDDQWNDTVVVSTMIEVSRSCLEAGNGKRGGNWKCDGRRGTGDRDGNSDMLGCKWKRVRKLQEVRLYSLYMRIIMRIIFVTKIIIKRHFVKKTLSKQFYKKKPLFRKYQNDIYTYAQKNVIQKKWDFLEWHSFGKIKIFNIKRHLRHYFYRYLTFIYGFRIDTKMCAISDKQRHKTLPRVTDTQTSWWRLIRYI